MNIKKGMLIIAMVIAIYSLCSCGSNKLADAETIITDQVALGKSMSLDFGEIDFTALKRSDEFEKYLEGILSQEYSAGNSSMLTNVVIELDENGYRNDALEDYFTNLILGDSPSLQEKVNAADYSYWQIFTSSNTVRDAFYSVTEINQDEIISAAEEQGGMIAVNNVGGYYDSPQNQYAELNEEIQSNGDIVTTSYKYFGDFAIETKKVEYYNKTYDTCYKYYSTLFYKGTEVESNKWEKGISENSGDVIDEDSEEIVFEDHVFVFDGNYFYDCSKDSVVIYEIKNSESDCVVKYKLSGALTISELAEKVYR